MRGPRSTGLIAIWLVVTLAVMLGWLALSDLVITPALERAARGEGPALVQRLIARASITFNSFEPAGFLVRSDRPFPTTIVARAWSETWTTRGAAALGAIGALSLVAWLSVRERARDRDEAGAIVDLDRTGARVAVAVLAATLGLFALPILMGRIYLADDLGNYYLPLRTIANEAIARGDDPGWCPSIQCGADIHAEGQLGLDHPLHALGYRLLPPDTFLIAELTGWYLFAVAGAFVLLRLWRLPPGAALVGAITFAFGGTGLMRYNHVNAVAVMCHLPWLLACAVLLARPGRSRRQAMTARVGIALLTASQGLSGYPHWVLIGLVSEAVLWVFLTIERRSIRPVIEYGAFKFIGLLMAASQVWPTAVALRDSSRAGADLDTRMAVSAQCSLHPLNLLQTINPYGFMGRVVSDEWSAPYVWQPRVSNVWTMNYTHELGHYQGLAAILLIAGAWLARPRGTDAATTTEQDQDQGPPRWLGAWCVTMVLVGVVLSLGRFTPLFPALARLPVVGVFRCYSRYSQVTTLGLAVGAALAFSRLGRDRQDGRRWPGRAAWGPAAVVLGFQALMLLSAFGAPDSAVSGLLSPRPYLLINAALAAVIVAVFVAAARGPAAAVVLLAMAQAADLGAYGVSHVWKADITMPPMAELRRRDGFPAEWFEHRVTVQGRNSNLPILAGMRLADGYQGLEPFKTIPLGDDPAALALADVIVVLPSWAPDKARGVVREPLAEIRLFSEAQYATIPDRHLAMIDPAVTAMVPTPIDLKLDPGPTGTARLVARWNTRFHIETTTPGRKLLVVAESFDPGWSATVDDQPAPVLRANGDYLGVVVPEGQHRVRLTWRSKPRDQGRWVALGGLVLLGIGLLLPVRRFSPESRRPPSSDPG
jgi:hypothetical protein